MVQQKLTTASIVSIYDTDVITTNAHAHGAPAVTLTFAPADVAITASNTITINAHGLTNDVGVYLYSTGTLPGGLAEITEYYVVNATTNTLQLADIVGGPAVPLSSQGTGTHYLLTGMEVNDEDPWDRVLTILNLLSLNTYVTDALNAAESPSASNRIITVSDMMGQLNARRAVVTVGPPGYGADFEGSDQTPFVDALNFITGNGGGWIFVLSGSYTFTSTLVVPAGVRIEGQHPLEVIISSAGNFPSMQLSGDHAELESIQFRAPLSTTSSVIKITGQSCVVERCYFRNYGFVGISFTEGLATGYRNKIQASRFETDTAGSWAIILQNGQNTVSHCSFGGTMPGGAVKIEGNASGIYNSYFAPEMTGPSYLVLSSAVSDARIVGNHFASVTSLDLSFDFGTASVRHANTPNSYFSTRTGTDVFSNQDNFIEPLAEYVGQPLENSIVAATTNSFTNDPSITKDLTAILDNPTAGVPSLDLLIQRSFEERNYFLTSTDPTFDSEGVPLSGVFSWNGSILTYPQFYIRSVFARNARWVVNAGSQDMTVPATPITPAPPAVDRIRVEITWGADPADVDAHMTFPNSVSGRNHVYYSNLSQEGTQLIQDDTTSFGPEIMTTTSLNDGIYRFSVHHFAGTSDMFTSPVTAVLKIDNVIVDTRNAPSAANLSGDLWRVWDINVVGGVPVSFSLIDDVIHAPLSEPDYHPSLLPPVTSDPSLLYVDIDQSLDNVDIVLTPQVAPLPLALNAPTDAYRHVLAFRLPDGRCVWMQGYRLLTGLTSFDVDGTPLPLVRYIGLTESRNPDDPFSGFAGATEAHLTEKLSSQSALLEELFARTNLGFEPLTADAEFVTEAKPGAWLSGIQLTSGLPSTPTHILEHQTQTYGLVPTSGLYRYSLATNSWAAIAGAPIGGPFTAMSTVGTEIALLDINGQVVTFDPRTLAWTLYNPTLTDKVTSLVPFPSVRGASFPDGGQADYHLQTSEHTYFTTLSGETIRFSLSAMAMDWVPRAFTEDVGENGLLGAALKDTGYNTLRDPSEQFETLDNGVSYTCALPVAAGKMLPLHDGLYAEFKSTDFSGLVHENFSHDQSSGAWISVSKNLAGTKFYIMGGGTDLSYLYAAVPTTAAQFSDFTPHFWAPNAHKQEVIALGKQTSSNTFAMLRGYYDVLTKTWIWVNQTLALAGTPHSKGAIAVYDYYPGGANVGDLYVLVSNISRGNRPSFWRRDGITGVWTYQTLIDSVSAPEDVLVPAAVGNSFDYDASSEGLHGFGVASPQGISFLVRDDSRSARPTLFHFDRITYFGVRLADAGGDVTLAGATANSATKIYGGIYHPASHSVYYVARDNGVTTRLFAQHQDTATLTGWSGLTIASSGLSLPYTGRSSNQVAVNMATGYVATATTYDFYLLTSSGISTVTITSATSTSFTSLSLSTNGRGASDVPSFGCTFSSPYVLKHGTYRGGEPSVEIGTWTSTSTYPIQGCGFGRNPGLGTGLFWYEPGTKVKNLGNNLWAGINRGGYLWIANASKGSNQVELTPSTSTARGDVVVASLGTITDYDFAFNQAGTQIAFVFADGGNANKLGFLLWDIASHSVVAYERAGFAPMVLPGASACASTPRISLNSFGNGSVPAWDIVVQDNSRLGGQVTYYQRLTNSASWVMEMLGDATDPGATKTLSGMVAQAGLNPPKSLAESNGNVVVASQVGAAGDLLVFYRQFSTSSWIRSTPTPLGSSGFVEPKLAKAGATYWVLGSSNGTNARVASSSTYTSGWALASVPLSSSYNRVSGAEIYTQANGVVVASPLLASGLIPSAQEFGIFRFQNLGTMSAKIFAAKGRLQAALYSGEEETSYSNHSWTYDGKLLYGATRPGRANPHYSIRVNTGSWSNLGDSALGSGRLISIGERTYREEYCDDAAQDLINEFEVNHVFKRSWTDLPIAERDVGNFTVLRYPFAADGGASSLFRTGNPTAGMAADAGLQSGTLGAVTSRGFPLILGQTRIQGGAGAGVLFHGAMAILASPPSTTNITYFGSASIGTNGMLKLEPQNTLTIKGSFRFREPSDALRSYTITGPLSFNLDGSTFGHLVLNFPTASTLTLDAAANPLTYWTALDHPQTTYPVVLGEVREKAFILYPGLKMDSKVVKLAFPSLELPDIADDLYHLTYCAPVSQYCISKVLGQTFYTTPTGIDSVSVKQVGSLHGFQRLEFPALDGNKHMLIAQGLPPVGTGFYFYTSVGFGTVAGTGDMRIKHVVGRYEDLILFNS